MKKELSILIILFVTMINNSLLSSNNNLPNKLSGNILKSQPLENHSLENGYSWSTSSGSINGSIANLTVDPSSTSTYIVEPSITCPQPIVIYTLKWDPINVVTPDPVISNQTGNTSVTWGISGTTNIDCPYYVNDPNHMINFIGTQSLISGTYNCTYAVYEGWKPVMNCSFNISINKITPSCPSSTYYFTDPNVCTAAVNIPNAGFNYPFNGTITYKITNGAAILTGNGFPGTQTLNKGTNTIEYTFSLNGQTETCSFTIDIIDNNAPVIPCTGPIELIADPVTCQASYTLSPATDLCGAAFTYCSLSGATNISRTALNSPITFGIGETNLILDAVDEAGNQAIPCAEKVIVKKGKFKIKECPAPKEKNTDPNKCYASIFLAYPTVETVCDGELTYFFTFSDATELPKTESKKIKVPYPFNKGTTKVTVEVQDAVGNTATCNYEVKVNDKELPKLTCPIASTVTATNPRQKIIVHNFDELPDKDIKDNCDDNFKGKQAILCYYETPGPKNTKIKHIIVQGKLPQKKISLPVSNIVLSLIVIYYAKDDAGNVGSCTTKIEVKPFTPKKAAISGNWSNSLTWESGQIPASTDDILIPSGISVTVSEDAACNNLVVDGNLIVASGKTQTVNGELFITATDGSISKGASSTGQLVLADNSAQLIVSGTVSIEKIIKDLNYHLFSSSIDNSTVDPLSGFTVAYYSEPTGKWVNLVKGQMLEQGKAYSIKNANNPLYPASTDLIFTSPNSTTLATGNITIPLTHTVGIGKGNGWNLVPNSYPCAANWKTMTTTASPTIYYWDGSKYVNYNKFNDENTGGTSIIPQGEGFFVYCPDEKNGCLLTMTNEDRLASNVSYSVSKKGPSTYPQIPNRLSLIVSGNGYTDQSVIAFVNDATSEYDINYDAFKLFSTQADVPLLNSNSLSKQYSVNYLSAGLVNQSKVQLEFTVGTAGEYTIHAENIGSFSATESIMLVDTKANTSTDLTQTGYKFTSEAVKADQRFYVEFSGLPTSIKKQNLDNELNIFTDKDQIIVQNKTGAKAQGIVTVYDVLGNEITTSHLTSNTETRIDMNTQANAIYFVKVKTQDQTLTKKICITK